MLFMLRIIHDEGVSNNVGKLHIDFQIDRQQTVDEIF